MISANFFFTLLPPNSLPNMPCCFGADSFFLLLLLFVAEATGSGSFVASVGDSYCMQEVRSLKEDLVRVLPIVLHTGSYNDRFGSITIVKPRNSFVNWNIDRLNAHTSSLTPSTGGGQAIARAALNIFSNPWATRVFERKPLIIGLWYQTVATEPAIIPSLLTSWLFKQPFPPL